jgi:hypothetical protein
MKGSFALVLLAPAMLMAACSGPASPTSASPANAVAPASDSAGPAGGTLQPLDVPFKGSMEGTQSVTPMAFPFLAVDGTAEGQATQLGRFTLHFPHTVNLTTKFGEGAYTFTAANGDLLTASFSGQAVGAGVVSIEEHATVTGGTGRFDGASGTFTVTRQFNQATGATSGTFDGTIHLAPAGHP